MDEYQAIYQGIPSWIKTGHRQETRELREVLREYVLFLSNTGVRHGTEATGIKWSNIRYFTGLDKHQYIEDSLRANHQTVRVLLRMGLLACTLGAG